MLTTAAVLAAVFTMRDLKFQRKTNDHHGDTVSLDCTLLVFAAQFDSVRLTDVLFLN